MADNNNGYWPADNGGQPEQPQNDNLQQDAPTTSDAQDQQFAQEPLGAPQEAPAQNDDAQQPQPEAQDTRPTQPLAPVAPTSEQAQASEPTQPLQPQPTQPLYRPAPEYGAWNVIIKAQYLFPCLLLGGNIDTDRHDRRPAVFRRHHTSLVMDPDIRLSLIHI